MPYNDKGQAHGCWEVYWSNDQIRYITNYINGGYFGYYQYNWISGKIDKEYYAI